MIGLLYMLNYCTVLYSTVQYCTVLYCTVQHSTIQYCAVLYSTVRTVPCFGMNDHPGRDTDVISRQSKSTIKDLSFYIGLSRIGSRIQDLGPCFGMNGNFRSDPDVIPRLSKSTIDFLAFYIGFGCLSSCLLYTSPSPRD